jgi:hypothetical protein
MLARLALVGVMVICGVSIAMLVLGKRPEPGSNWTIDGVRFETTGWQLREATADAMAWANPEGDALTLKKVAGSADVPATTDLASLRAHCRRLATSNGGSLVYAAFVGRAQAGVAALIYKREELPAYAYTAMVIVPHGAAHYLLTVASVERGTTGVRDALATVQLMQQGKLDPTKTDANRRVQGWFKDPYDPKYDRTTIHSVADAEEFDSLVPLHPLSKVRATLRTIEKSLKVQ